MLPLVSGAIDTLQKSLVMLFDLKKKVFQLTESKLLIQLQLNLVVCEFHLCRFAYSRKIIKSPTQIPVVHMWLYVDMHTMVKKSKTFNTHVPCHTRQCSTSSL